MRTDPRIAYNPPQGHFEVTFNGRLLSKTFPSAKGATRHLRALDEGRFPPQFAAPTTEEGTK